MDLNPPEKKNSALNANMKHPENSAQDTDPNFLKICYRSKTSANFAPDTDLKRPEN
jgi:hypothetical protein